MPAGLASPRRSSSASTRSCAEHAHADEGVWSEGGVLAALAGPRRVILAAERVALNFLGGCPGGDADGALRRRRGRARACGSSTPARPRRAAGAREGGGAPRRRLNHRNGLDDACSSRRTTRRSPAAWRWPPGSRSRRRRPGVEVEVESRRSRSSTTRWRPGRRGAARQHDARPAARRGRARRRPRRAGGSGGITLGRSARRRDRGRLISVGALTHSAPALDVSLLLEPLE